MDRMQTELLLVAIMASGIMADRREGDGANAAAVFEIIEHSLSEAKIIGPHSALRNGQYRTGDDLPGSPPDPSWGDR